VFLAVGDEESGQGNGGTHEFRVSCWVGLSLEGVGFCFIGGYGAGGWRRGELF
jgi:hypothetical protein